jgi:trk system potassium uptake protein
MLLRPDRSDLRIIALNTGRVLLGLGVVMLIPAVLGVLLREYNEAAGFSIGASLSLLLGCAAQFTARSRKEPQWHHGMVVAALSWLLAPFVAAIPLHLSGHYGSFLDAYFDAMSGFATAGLAVINDLDHLAASVNLWRHMMQFMGGQGLVLIMLTFFAAGHGAAGMYAGEAREDRIMPNVVRTARFIWRVSLAWLLAGTAAVGIALLWAGLPLRDAPLHALALFMAAFDTGGFAPTSASLGLYHSAAVEGVISVLMVAGALSFALHSHLWRRRYGELHANVEVRYLTASVLGLFLVSAWGLLTAGAYDSAEELFRRGFFHVLSAHTGTGFGTIPGGLLLTSWGPLAPAAVVVAMGMGPMAGSTGGGIKMIRFALVGRFLRLQIRRVLLPSDAVTRATYHSGRRHAVRDHVVQAALLVLLLYLALYLVGALVGLYYGYPFEEAMFESTSAAAAVGLSVGVTGPSMETGLKVVYILQMWLGRLEFIAVLVLLGFLWSLLRGRT